METNFMNTNIINTMWFLDIDSLAKVLKWYRWNTSNWSIEDIGFNTTSWYVYICLDNWIQICSCFGNDVEFLVTNFENWDEYFFDDYEEARQKQDELYFNYWINEN
jgi:hypothetical protein